MYTCAPYMWSIDGDQRNRAETRFHHVREALYPGMPHGGLSTLRYIYIFYFWIGGFEEVIAESSLRLAPPPWFVPSLY